jgi:hypothetical protein
MHRPADAAMCLREAAETYSARLGSDAPLTRTAREKLAAVDRSLASVQPPPSTQPFAGFGQPADEVTWFGCLATIAEQLHDPEAVQIQTSTVQRYIKYHPAEAPPIVRALERMNTPLKQKPAR